MANSHKIPQLYGYAVCLVAVIAFLISVTQFVTAVFDLRDPLHIGPSWLRTDIIQTNLASFETYKMGVIKEMLRCEDIEARDYIPDDETLRGMYEAAKADKIQAGRVHARREFTGNGILIIVCVALFATHLTWVRRFTTPKNNGPEA